MDLSVLNLNPMSTEFIGEVNDIRCYVAARRVKMISSKVLADELGVDPRVLSAFERRYASIDTDFCQKYKEALEKLLSEGASHGKN